VSFFDDQEDDWYANDCKGSPSDYDGAGGIGEWATNRKYKGKGGGGPNRSLLALTKIEEFAAWAGTQGYRRETVKGEYEILRLRISGQSPLLFYRKDHSLSGGEPKHATAQSDGTQLILRWLKSRKVKPLSSQ
jgi:hypothetical protein